VRAIVGGAIAAAFVGSILAAGCLGRSGGQTASNPANDPAPLVGVPDGAPSAGQRGAPDFFAAKPILDDERLAPVKAVVADPARAAQALADLIDSSPPAAGDLWRWRYQLAMLRFAAGDFAAAAQAYDLVAGADGSLKAYADLGAAQALIKASRFEEAIVRASRVPADLPIGPASRLLVADAYEALRDYDKAIAIWLEHLASGRHPARWMEIALRTADAILANSPDPDRAERAGRLARRVIVEAPTSAAVDRAVDLDRKAVALVPKDKKWRALIAHGKRGAFLPSDYAAALSPEDQLARAAALSEAQSFKEAEAAIDAMPLSAASGEVACKAVVLRAQVQSKQKERAKAADGFGAAIEKCEGYPDPLAEALLAGGRASVSINQCDEASRRFERLEKDLRTHRFADDARLRRAECALTMGDEQRYADLLTSMPDDYPEGDMVGDGLFRLALRKMTKGEWPAALPVLTRALSFKADEPGSAKGRVAYFRARALVAVGDAAGKDALAGVIADYPLSYYMLHAYARLSEMDEGRARAALAQAIVREPAGPFVSGGEPVFGSPEFARAIELLCQGETDFARREIGRLAQDGAPPDALWAAAFLHSRSGAFALSHAIPRARVSDWQAHYPAGRWREPWEIAFPRPYAIAVDRETKRSGIPASLAYAIMREESAFDPDAVSPSRAYGLMQLIMPTARHVAKAMGRSCDETSLHDPDVNVALGSRFLADLRGRFPGNPHLAIPSYNAGPGALQRWITARPSDDFDLWVEQIPYDETRRYTKRVMTSYAAYLFLYEKEAFDSALRLPKLVQR
jgi:soluble lytic murein transglycosylase